MKNLNKIVVLLAAMAMVLLLAGCGGKERDVSGDYRATYNVKDMLNQELAASGMTMNSDVNAEFILQLNPDKSFLFDIDAETFQRKYLDVLQKEGPAIVQTMLEQEGITEDLHDAIAAASGYESYDTFVNGMMEEIVAAAGTGLAEQVRNAAHTEGTYSVSKDTITLTAGTEGGQGLDKGTVNEDGTISVTAMPDEATTLNLTFVRQ